jgi:hypothetical protein
MPVKMWRNKCLPAKKLSLFASSTSPQVAICRRKTKHIFRKQSLSKPENHQIITADAPASSMPNPNEKVSSLARVSPWQASTQLMNIQKSFALIEMPPDAALLGENA